MEVPFHRILRSRLSANGPNVLCAILLPFLKSRNWSTSLTWPETKRVSAKALTQCRSGSLALFGAFDTGTQDSSAAIFDPVSLDNTSDRLRTCLIGIGCPGILFMASQGVPIERQIGIMVRYRNVMVNNGCCDRMSLSSRFAAVRSLDLCNH